MRSPFAALALLTLLAAPALAQQTPANSAHLASASELVDLLRLADRQIPDMTGLTSGLAADNPMMPVMAEIMTEFYQEFAPWEKVRSDVVKIYADAYTEAELRQLIEFYHTPLGQKVIEKEPDIAAATREVTQNLLMPHMFELQQRVMSRIGGGQ